MLGFVTIYSTEIVILVRTVTDFLLILVLVAEGNTDIYNGFKKNILTTNTSGNRRENGCEN